jgi:hypothetical protein
MSAVFRLLAHRRSTATLIIVGALTVLAWRPWETRLPSTTAASLTMVSIPRQVPGNDAKIPTTPEENDDPAPEEVTTPIASKPSILGFWRDDFYGKRIFEFRDDGTATMVIELDAIGKALYGPQLKFFIDWKMDGDVVKLKMTGGEPASAFSAAKIFGESSEQRIESLEENEMKLRSLDSNKLYTHRRVAGWE